MLKSDYHIHPLNHRYRDVPPADLRSIQLTEDDRACVRTVVDWCVYERGLNSIALTDHDMTAAGIYGQEYARHNGLDIDIVIGAECEVTAPGCPPGKDWVHVLCYCIEPLPEYTHSTPLPVFVEAAREQGAYLVMAHPVMYPHIFEKFHSLFDGYEVQSGTTPAFLQRTSAIRQFSNSDFHYSGVLPDVLTPSLWNNKFVCDFRRE